MGPSAVRIAGLHDALSRIGYTVEDHGDVTIPAPETCPPGDPRAKYLKEMCFRIGKKLKQEHWCRLSTQIEETAVEELKRKGKDTIKPNVDFFSAPVYHMMGIPGDLMTPIFAVSRIAGWTAHIIEEKFGDAHGDKPALYRPSAEYTGSYCGKEACAYTPIEETVRRILESAR